MVHEVDNAQYDSGELALMKTQYAQMLAVNAGPTAKPPLVLKDLCTPTTTRVIPLSPKRLPKPLVPYWNTYACTLIHAVVARVRTGSEGRRFMAVRTLNGKAVAFGTLGRDGQGGLFLSAACKRFT